MIICKEGIEKKLKCRLHERISRCLKHLESTHILNAEGQSIPKMEYKLPLTKKGATKC